MKRSVKLADVARAAGVSQGTASNVFAKPELVRPEVRERVEEVARALGYHGPDPRGRLLRAGNATLILSFLGEFFVEGNRGACSASEVAAALDNHL